MIVADRKSLEEILGMVADRENSLSSDARDV